MTHQHRRGVSLLVWLAVVCIVSTTLQRQGALAQSVGSSSSSGRSASVDAYPLLPIDGESFTALIGHDAAATVIVYITTADCPSCSKSAEMEAVLLASSFADSKDVTVAVASVTTNPELADMLDFDEHDDVAPAFRAFRRGELHARRFAGDIEHAALVHWANSIMETNVVDSFVEKLNQHNFARVAHHRRRTVLVEFYTPWCTHCKELVPALEAAARAFRDEKSVDIAKVDGAAEPELAKSHGIQGFPALLVFHAGADAKVPKPYSGTTTTAGFIEYLNKHAGTFRTLDGGLSQLAGRVPEADAIVRPFHGASMSGKRRIQTELSTLHSSAPRGTKSAIKAYVDMIRGALNSENPHAFLEGEKARLRAKLEDGTRAPARALAAFYQKRLNILEVLHPTPIDYSTGTVLVLTPDNFEQVVQPERNVLVEFYAPWCGHCKRLEPEYIEVATAFAGDGTTVVAKLDADEHKELAARYGIKGYPTLKLFRSGTREPETYSGLRTAERIIAYVRDKSSVALKDEL